jgi:hypothetical protein
VHLPNSQHGQKYQISANPSHGPVLDEFKNPETREIAVVAPTGWGKTTVFEVLNTYVVAEAPGDTLMVGQTEPMIKKWVKSRMQKVWKSSPCTSRLLPSGAAMTNLAVIFPHMNWFAAPANETSLQESSMTNCFGDEPWRWDPGMIGYFMKRMHDRWNRKALLQSQGGTEGGEWHEFARLGKWMDCQHVCPSCETAQGFSWEMFQYEQIRDGNDEFDWPAIFETVRLRCQSCGEEFADTEKNRRKWAGGKEYKWNGNRHLPGRVTFNASFLSVWRIAWSEVVKEWILAQDAKRRGDLTKLQQIINQRFAQFWAEPSDTPVLEQKGDPYRKKAYHEGEKCEGEHFRFMTIDVQKGHFWAVIRAWKLGGEGRLLWEGKVLAWENLRHLQSRYGLENRHVFADGRYEPEMVAKECEKARTEKDDQPWNMLMGETGDGYRVKISPKRTVRRVYSDFIHSRSMAGFRYRFIKFSNLLAKNQLAVLMGGDGFGIPVDVSKQYQAQLQSEKKVEKSPGKWEWQPIKKTHSNNHLWDCEVMQVVAACLFKVLVATVED